MPIGFLAATLCDAGSRMAQFAHRHHRRRGLPIPDRRGLSAIRGAEGLGLGDIYLLGMVGAFLGWPGALFTLFAGSIFGSIGGLAISACRTVILD